MDQSKPKCRWTFMGVFLIVTGILCACNPEPKQTTTETEKPAETRPADTPAIKIDAKADKVLRDMSAKLTSLETFALKTKSYFEVVDSGGKKTRMDRTSKLTVQRPDQVVAFVSGERGDIEMYYNKNNFNLYHKKSNKYATIAAPDNIDKTVMFLEDSLDIFLPISDLIHSDPYKVLMEDVVSGTYVDQAKVGDKMAHHLAFMGNDVDWQLWVDTASNLPLRYVITSKKETSSPESVTEITEWNTEIRCTPEMFTFTPPKGAKKIDFLAERSWKRKQNQTK